MFIIMLVEGLSPVLLTSPKRNAIHGLLSLNFLALRLLKTSSIIAAGIAYQRLWEQVPAFPV